MPTPEQVRLALRNTLRKPRNVAPLIQQALKKEKTRRREANSSYKWKAGAEGLTRTPAKETSNGRTDYTFSP